MVFNHPKKKFKPGPKEFPNLQSKPFIPYNEKIKGRKTLSTTSKLDGDQKTQENKPINFYKFQKEN